MNIATVVEGPTDRMVLEAVIKHLVPGAHCFFRLQPVSIGDTYGETGTGWKGVRRWCQDTWQLPDASLELLLSGQSGEAIDILVIHVDADVATEQDLLDGADDTPPLEVNKPCPPIQDTIEGLKRIIVEKWLNSSELPYQVVFAIPSQDMENWTFAALFPRDPLCARPAYECFQSGKQWPGYLLTLQEYAVNGKKLLKRSSGRVKKHRRNYGKVLATISARWVDVRRICTQAENFSEDLLLTARERKSRRKG